MTDPTSPVPPQEPATNPKPNAPNAAAPPAGAAVPPPGAPVPPAATLPRTVTPPTARSTAKVWAIGGVAMVVALCCSGVGIANLVRGGAGETTASAGSSTSARPTGVTPTTATPSTAAPTTAAPTTAPAYATPTKKDFKLGVKVLRKQCFGSAGCNITYRINVTYTGTGLDPSKTYEVTYEVKGGEDPMVNTFEVTGDSASVQQEESGSTRRASDKLTAVVTDVSEL